VAVSDVAPPKVRAKVQKEFSSQVNDRNIDLILVIGLSVNFARNICNNFIHVCQVLPQIQPEDTQRVIIRPPLHKFPVAAAPSVVVDDSEVASTFSDNEEMDIERLLLLLKAPPMEGAWGHNQNRKWVKVRKAGK
jgi:hypothetical protein